MGSWRGLAYMHIHVHKCIYISYQYLQLYTYLHIFTPFFSHVWFVGTYRVELLQPFNSKSMMVVFGGPKLPIIAPENRRNSQPKFEEIYNHWENLGAKASKPLVLRECLVFFLFSIFFCSGVRTMVTIGPGFLNTETVFSTKNWEFPSPQVKKTQPQPEALNSRLNLEAQELRRRPGWPGWFALDLVGLNYMDGLAVGYLLLLVVLRWLCCVGCFEM